MAQKAPMILNEKIVMEKFIPGGQAIGSLQNGKKAMLWNILPGETATKVQITRNKSTYFEGIALEYENENQTLRNTPRDQGYLATSPWQILDYDYELAEKCNLVAEVLKQQKISLQNLTISPTVTDKNLISSLDASDKNLAIQPTITDNQAYFYRNKMEYALYFDHTDEKIHLAFHARGSHRKVPIKGSSLERPEIFQKATEVVNELNTIHADARKYQSLLLRSNRLGEVSGGLFENGKKHPDFPKLEDKILGIDYHYSPNGFFQINLPVYELALSEMKNWILGEKVLDLYSGVGTIGLSVARDLDLTLVECDKSAYRELETNTKEAISTTNSAKITPIFTKSEEVLDFIQPDQTVILDPPRAGCHQTLIEKLLEISPARIIYLSCNPITQARDISFLQEKYEINLIQPYNFFPRTPHIENLIVLTRLN